MFEAVRTWLAVEPLDTVVVRDGRGIDADSQAVVPLPSTVGGAVGAAVGQEIDRHLLGPFLFDREPVFVVPRDVVTDEYGDVWRLRVRGLDADERSDLPARIDHVLDGDGESVQGLWTVEAMTEWLHGEGPVAPGQRVDREWWSRRHRRSPWHTERRTGLALHPDGDMRKTAIAGMLYSAEHLRPVDGTRLLVGCVSSTDIVLRRSVVAFGGLGRRAVVRVVEAPELPRSPQVYPGGRVTVYLATPALLDNIYWQPSGARLRAIAVAGPEPVATASRRQGFWGSRRMSWAAPAGTVFYLDFGDPETAERWVRSSAGRLLPGQTEGLRMVDAGFGSFFTGRW